MTLLASPFALSVFPSSFPGAMILPGFIDGNPLSITNDLPFDGAGSAVPTIERSTVLELPQLGRKEFLAVSPKQVIAIEGPFDAALRQGGAVDFFVANGFHAVFSRYTAVTNKVGFGLVATHKPTGREVVYARGDTADELIQLGETAANALLRGVLTAYDFGEVRDEDLHIATTPVHLNPQTTFSDHGQISWNGALGFIEWLNRETRSTREQNGFGPFRLPSRQTWQSRPATEKPTLIITKKAERYPISPDVTALFNPALIKAQKLPPNHPGARDSDYPAQRETIADQARKFLQAGDLTAQVPDVNYSAEEHEAWQKIWTFLRPALEKMSCKEYWDKLQELNFSEDTIPQMEALNEVIFPQTGFRFAPVEGLLHPASFLAIMANRIFPAAQFLRFIKGDKWKYSVEPDFFHELAHAVSLSIAEHAAVNEAFGKAALRVIEEVSRYSDPADQMKIAQEWTGRLGALYWWGVEFYLTLEDAPEDASKDQLFEVDGKKGVVKMAGPGALSSTGELTNVGVAAGVMKAAHGDPVTFRQLNPQQMERDRLIDVTEYQDRMYVATTYQDWARKMLHYLRNWPHGNLDPRDIKPAYDYESVLNTPLQAQTEIIDQIAETAMKGDLFESAYCVKTLILLMSHEVDHAYPTLYRVITGVSVDDEFNRDQVLARLESLPVLKQALNKVKMDVLVHMQGFEGGRQILGLFKDIVGRSELSELDLSIETHLATEAAP